MQKYYQHSRNCQRKQSDSVQQEKQNSVSDSLSAVQITIWLLFANLVAKWRPKKACLRYRGIADV